MCLTKARVHFQHSAELLNRLVKVDANYSLQLYPDEGHILRDPRSIQHFKRTVVTYFQNCLKHSLFQDPVEDDDEEDDDWARCSLPTSWMTLPGLYAILCITLGWSTRHKSTGAGTKHIRSPHATSGKFGVWLKIAAHNYFPLYIQKSVCLQNTVETKWTRRLLILLKVYSFKHACLNGCMISISLHFLNFPGFNVTHQN